MSSDSSKYELSEAELRELIPQLQQITEQYKNAERIQKALFKVSELASSVSNLALLFPAIHEIIADFMDAANFFVALNPTNSEIVEMAYFVDERDEKVVKEISKAKLKKGLTGYILDSGNHVFYREDADNDIVNNFNYQVNGSMPKQLLGVPLKRGTQVIGAMVVQTYDPNVEYSQDDLELLLFISQHIVTTVDRVKNRELTERTIRDRTRQLRKINDDLQEEILERQKVESLQGALFEISELSAVASQDTDTFYASIHEILARLISAPNCYIAVLNETRERLHFPYFSDTEQLERPKDRPLGFGLTEFVIRQGHAELIDPSRILALTEAGEIDVSIAQQILRQANSWLGSPLIIDGEVYGVIAVQTYGKSAKYTPRDLELMRFVSHHIAVALERKQRAEAIRAHNEKLEERVQARTDELNRVNDNLRKQIEERKEIELKLIHDAHHDSLTDLPNRSMFSNRLELAIANKRRYPKNLFAVLFIDLDRFKIINDTLGHHAGDDFLIEVAKRITQCIRGHDLLARHGGDEFVLLLDNFEHISDVEEIAMRIIESISQPFVLDEKEMYSGASIGIAHIETYYRNAEEVIRDADAAMYQAKSQGRGRFVLFDKSMRERLLEELELENDFRRSLRNQEFYCYQQPVVNLRTNETLYHEMYWRWEHPTMGKISREQFRQVAEQSGLTLDLDQYQLRAACAVLKQWQTEQQVNAQAKIAVNISINHLLQSSLVNRMLEIINSSEMSPECFVFEFDENDLNRRSQFILPAIKKLKRAGVTLVLDNFGSGLASLSYLFSYPFDFIKIDHRFIKSLPRSKRNAKLIQSVMLISEHLKFEVIAEGIENATQLKALGAIDCHLGQGKYIQEPQILHVDILLPDQLVVD